MVVFLLLYQYQMDYWVSRNWTVQSPPTVTVLGGHGQGFPLSLAGRQGQGRGWCSLRDSVAYVALLPSRPTMGAFFSRLLARTLLYCPWLFSSFSGAGE